MGSSRVILSLELHSLVIDTKLPALSWGNLVNLRIWLQTYAKEVDNSEDNFDYRSILKWKGIKTFIWHEKLEVPGNKAKTSKTV